MKGFQKVYTNQAYNIYRDTYIEVFEDKGGYTVIVYCDVKPGEEVRLFKEFDRLIICIGMERVEYGDETTCMDDERITGKVDWHQYKYIFKIPIESNFRIKNYKIDRDALIIKLKKI